MSGLKLGVLLDCLRMPLDRAIDAAAAMKVDGAQVFATKGETAPWNLDRAARRALRQKFERRGLELSALCADLGGHGFERAAENAEKVEKTEAIIDLAAELGVAVVTTHIGVVPPERNERYSTMLLAMRRLASYAETKRVFVAIETGPEPPDVLGSFIDAVGETNLKVNFDPANLVMIHGIRPADAVNALKRHIVYTHAKDGRMVRRGDPVAIYDAFARGAPEDFRFDDYFRELPLGAGDVDFPSYLAALREIRYSGYATIEREAADDPAGDIGAGVEFLKAQIASAFG